MIKLTYKSFIELIKNKKVIYLLFSVKEYNHYNHCVIKTSFEKTPSSFIYIINCVLTVDETEKVSFLNIFKENYKLFKFGRKGSFSLKDVWNKIDIICFEIV